MVPCATTDWFAPALATGGWYTELIETIDGRLSTLPSFTINWAT